MNQGNKNGYSYHYIYEYLPSQFEATVEQKKVRNLVWKFRDGDYQTIYNLILNGIEEIISGDNAPWTVCCIPAHSEAKTQKRFEAILQQFSKELDVNNGYSVVSIKEDFVGSVFKTEPRSILPNLDFNNTGISGNRIILIDDVIKGGRSFYEVADKLVSLGASEVIGFFIALTIKPDSIENIKKALIKACVKSRPSYFKSFLESDKVTTEFPDKERFYKFFKYMLSVSRKMSEGELHLKMKLPDPENKNVQNYEFYDLVHVHPRLTIIVKEYNDSIHLDIAPF